MLVKPMKGTRLGSADPAEGGCPYLWGPGGEGAEKRSRVGGVAQGAVAVAPAGQAAGSELGPGVALEQSPHVQERLLQIVRQVDCVGVGTAVVG